MNFIYLGLLAGTGTALRQCSVSCELAMGEVVSSTPCSPLFLQRSLLSESWACLYVTKVAKMHFSPQAIPSSLCGCSSLEKIKLLALEKLMTLIFIPNYVCQGGSGCRVPHCTRALLSP